MQKLQHQTLSFGDFTFDLSRGCLLRGNDEVKLRPKSFAVLKYLIENSGRLVQKEELISAVWPDTAVTDDSLVQCLIEVRRALNDVGQRIVKTVPRRGYIFDAQVTGFEPAGRELVYTEEVEGVRIAIEEELGEGEGGKTLALPSVQKGRTRVLALGLAGAAVALAAITLVSYGHRLAPGAGQPTPIRSIAVLPFANLSGDRAQEYFADGMTEALIGRLAQLGSLKVISRTSVMRYKGSNRSLPEIARELNVDAVLEGTVQRSGERVRITAKLIQAVTDSPMWAQDYERDLSDVLKLQSEVARAVVDEIHIQVTPDERTRLAAAPNIDPQVHDEYLLGRHHLRTNEDDLRQAIGHFERAIQLAPDYAAAYAGLSNAWLQRSVWGAKDHKQMMEMMPLARDNALKAVKLDPQLVEAHIALGQIKIFDWDWAGAEAALTRALELDPHSAEAHRTYGDLLSALERHAEAIREMHSAEELDPLSSVTQSRYARALYRARKYEEALPHVQRAIDLDPNLGNVMPYWIQGNLYEQMNRHDEAIASLKKAQSHGGNAQEISAEIARVYARIGKQNEARRMLEELKATTDPASFSSFGVASAYAALGDKDGAFKVLFHMIEERNVATHIKADPQFESLHSDPRWKELLSQMNFPTD
ncbi:MAG: FlgO family outer membrane protein [Pyrinomonadaceae bacterium]